VKENIDPVAKLLQGSHFSKPTDLPEETKVTTNLLQGCWKSNQKEGAGRSRAKAWGLTLADSGVRSCHNKSKKALRCIHHESHRSNLPIDVLVAYADHS
jgi:hypothetical protein